MKLIIGSQLIIVNPDEELLARVYKELVIPNPVYYTQKSMGRWNNQEPQKIQMFTHGGNVLELPRGVDLSNELPRFDEIDYKMSPGFPVQFSELKITPFPFQEEAADIFAKTGQGGVIAPCGAGKTEIAIVAMSKLQVSTLILVHSKDLMKQWQDRIQSRLGYTAGIIAAGKVSIKPITIATVQSLYSNSGIMKYTAETFYRQFGLVILDEAHHAPAKSWMVILAKCPAARRLWLTATENRRDGLGPLIPLSCGKIIYRIKHADLLLLNRILPPTYIQHNLTFLNGTFKKKALIDGEPKDILDKTLLDKVIRYNTDRTTAIVKNIMLDYHAGRTILALSQKSVALCEAIHDQIMLQNVVPLILVASGKYAVTKDTEREALFNKIREGKSRILIATNIAEEGLDLPMLDSIHLTYPSGECEQAVGRVCRVKEGKVDALVHDYVDINVEYLVDLAVKRKRIIHKLGGTCK